jgi:hypothetical protein
MVFIEPHTYNGQGDDETVLTKIEVAALRRADGVVFRYWEGRHLIRASKKADAASGFDQAREIAVSGRITSYRRPAAEFMDAFCLIAAARFCPEWRTVASLLRAGDRLELAWIADNNTKILEEAKLHRDELRLHVLRSVKEGRTNRMVFGIEVQVSLDNADRMMCPAGQPDR